MRIGLRKKFLTNNDSFRPAHPEYRRALMLNVALTMLYILCLFFAYADAFISSRYQPAAVHAIVAIVSLISLLYFHKTNDLKTSSYAAVLMLLTAIINFLVDADNQFYALYWLCIFPPVAYFLLGRKAARFITITYFFLVAAYIGFAHRYWTPAAFSIESVVNIAAATLCLIVLINYYELCREEVAAALKEKINLLEIMSVTDSLTGLYGKPKLDEVIQAEISRVSRGGTVFSVIFADVDHYKQINDVYGHIEGDSILAQIGQVLKDNCRKTDTAGRWGGDEFVIICSVTDLQGAFTLAEKLLQKVKAHAFPIGREVTMSFGVASFVPGDTQESIMARADKALYTAKSNGRSQVEILRLQEQT